MAAFDLNLKALLIVSIVFFMTVPCFGTNVMSNHPGTLKDNVCGTRNIQCICGIGPSKHIITVEQKLYLTEVSANHTQCIGVPDPYRICANYSCFLAPNQTIGHTGTALNKPKRHIVDTFYPQEIFVPRSNGSSRRVARQGEPCYIPQLKNAEIKCYKWPNWMNCDVTCIFGHALQSTKDTATTVNINCRNTDNVWKPHGFQDCQPYINCQTLLVKPGNLKCKEPIDGPPFCEISCLDYDQYDATALQKYECVDDSFARTLPHCAKLKDNVPLVKKPGK